MRSGEVLSEVSRTRWRLVQSMELIPIAERSSGPGVRAMTFVPAASTIAISRVRPLVTH